MKPALDIRNAADLYAVLGVDPFASEKEISDSFAARTSEFAQLSDEEKATRLKELQRVAAILNDPVQRVQLNAALPERIDAKTIDTFLATVEGLSIEELRVPEPSIADVYTEGGSHELMAEDLEPPSPIADLELDFDSLNQTLSNSLKDRELFFDS